MPTTFDSLSADEKVGLREIARAAVAAQERLVTMTATLTAQRDAAYDTLRRALRMSGKSVPTPITSVTVKTDAGRGLASITVNE